MLDDDWQKEVKIDLIFLNCLIPLFLQAMPKLLCVSAQFGCSFREI